MTAGTVYCDENDMNKGKTGPPTSTSAPLAPYFTSLHKMSRTFMGLPAGSVARFRCNADGNPTPTIRWLKDGEEIDYIRFGFKVRLRKWTLVLHDLVPVDNGCYTCIVTNQYGSINATYELDVIPRIFHEPIMNPAKPENTTVMVGHTAIFRCEVVVSDQDPRIHWLKHLGKDDSNDPNDIGHFKEMQTEPQSQSDPFTCSLIIQNVTFDDAGKYTCLAGNAIGISYQSAWLTVIPPPEPTTKPNIMLHFTKTPYVPWTEAYKTTLIVLGVALFILVIVTIACICLCVMGQKKRDVKWEMVSTSMQSMV
ncbi:fibroblast growth factor receptor 2-like [Ptychodera flava]|uniref:fibroblast growth factor receptor 2-like n=1 Tax=Ptychodera flava TaxID=63121 RepID=UPI003969DFD3